MRGLTSWLARSAVSSEGPGTGTGDTAPPELPEPEDFRPVRDFVELPEPKQVAHEALNRAKAAARARGVRPGQQRARILAPEQSRSGSRKDGRDPQLFADALGSLLAQRGWVNDVSVGGVIGRWREVVGDEIADRCTPLTFEDRALVVRADSTAWATQLRILTPQLLGRLAQEIGEGVVEEITVLGPAGPTFRRGRRTVQGRGPRDTFG